MQKRAWTLSAKELPGAGKWFPAPLTPKGGAGDYYLNPPTEPLNLKPRTPPVPNTGGGIEIPNGVGNESSRLPTCPVFLTPQPLAEPQVKGGLGAPPNFAFRLMADTLPTSAWGMLNQSHDHHGLRLA